MSTPSPGRRSLVRRCQSAGNGSHPRMTDITSTRKRSALVPGSESDTRDREADASRQAGAQTPVAPASLQSRAQPLQILRVTQHREIRIAAELSGAVENAGLPAHEQCAHVCFRKSRKDFANRARGQGCLPWLIDGPQFLALAEPLRRRQRPPFLLLGVQLGQFMSSISYPFQPELPSPAIRQPRVHVVVEQHARQCNAFPPSAQAFRRPVVRSGWKPVPRGGQAGSLSHYQ